MYRKTAILLRQDKHHLNAADLNDLAAYEMMSLAAAKDLVVNSDAVPSIDHDEPLSRIKVKVDLGVEPGHHLARTEVDMNSVGVSVACGAPINAGGGAAGGSWVRALRRTANVVSQLLDIEGPTFASQLRVCLDTILAMLLMERVSMVFAGLDKLFWEGEARDEGRDQLVVVHLDASAVPRQRCWLRLRLLRGLFDLEGWLACTA